MTAQSPLLATARAEAGETGSRRLLPLALACGSAAAIFAIGQLSLVPLVAVSLYVGAVVLVDVAENRIPNLLTFPALGLGIAWAGWDAGWVGVAASTLGAAVALLIFVLPYASGAIGAGDAKGAMALGAWIGPLPLLSVAVWSLVFGGAIALGWVTVRGQLPGFLRRWGKILWLSLASARPSYIPPPPGSAASRGIPFGVAMALGLIAQQWMAAP